MTKKVFGRKLSRERSSRELLFVSLVESLVLHGKIKTTKAKAKSIIGLIDRLVVLAKKGTLASKRQVLKRLKGNKEVSTLLWTNIAKTFETRNGGYTRIIPLTQRKGDMAEMVRIEWTDEMKSSVNAIKKDVKNVSTKTKRS
ncbi:MAG: 50S ribosomal protein L17 [Candidatus Woesebacteria bacterium]|nr:50S ribosomal protein L17 [Candidatus Woesebacteria bacterium]